MQNWKNKCAFNNNFQITANIVYHYKGKHPEILLKLNWCVIKGKTFSYHYLREHDSKTLLLELLWIH